MEATGPLGTVLIVLSLLLLVLFGTAASIGMVVVFIPSLRPWVAEQLRRLLELLKGSR